MPYTLDIDAERGLLDLRYHGVVSVAQRQAAWREAEPMLRATGIRRILIDLVAASAAQEPLANTREFVGTLLREPLLRQSRTAFVSPPAHPVNHLLELQADAHHYPFSRFSDRDEAIAWLLGDTPPLGPNLAQ